MRTLALLIGSLVALGGGAVPAAAIVGGSVVGPSESYPFLGALVDHPIASAYDGFFCGGTLVAPMLVLTAAHCVADRTATPGSIDVVLGQTSLVATGGERIGVSEVLVSPAFDQTMLASDVAVLQLARPAAGAPILLATIPPATGTLTRLLGWGNLTGLGGAAAYPTMLQRLDRFVLDSSACDVYAQFRPSLELCAGDLAELHGACDGDSGGPLLTRDTPLTWQLVGTVSYAGSPCAQANAATVFQRSDVIATFLESVLPPRAPIVHVDDLRNGRVRVRWTARPGALPTGHVSVSVGAATTAPAAAATSVELPGLPRDRSLVVAVTTGNVRYGDAQATASFVIIGRPRNAAAPGVQVRSGIARCTGPTWRGILPIRVATRWLIDNRWGPVAASLRVTGLRGHRIACIVTATSQDGSRTARSTTRVVR